MSTRTPTKKNPSTPASMKITPATAAGGNSTGNSAISPAMIPIVMAAPA